HWMFCRVEPSFRAMNRLLRKVLTHPFTSTGSPWGCICSTSLMEYLFMECCHFSGPKIGLWEKIWAMDQPILKGREALFLPGVPFFGQDIDLGGPEHFFV